MTMIGNDDDENGDIRYIDERKGKTVDAYSNLPKGLTTEELAQSGTQKLILYDLEKTSAKVKSLEPYQEKYYDELSKKLVLEEKLSKTKRAEILYSFCITGGGLIIGYSNTVIKVDRSAGVIGYVLGGLLIIGGILFKLGKK